MSEDLVQIETLVIEMLLVISLVAIAVQRLRVPYTVALVGVGLLIGLVQPALTEIVGPIEIELTPELILALFVPPLIFEAAFNLSYDELKRNFLAILIFAVPGVVVTMLVVGFIVAGTTGLTLPVALVFGALIAATDPVAVISLFRTLGVPKRLAVLVEGESLFNDGTAIIVFHVVLGVALTGQLHAVQAVLDFIQVVVGGIFVGVTLGWAVAWLIARVDNHLIETTLTTVLAFGVYLVAERFQFSGVLAVVAAGIINGQRSNSGMSPTTRIVLNSFWEYMAFLANSLLFFLIGFEINVSALLENWQAILGAIVAVILARILVVYVGSWIVNRTFNSLPFSWQHVLAWGGLRGAISLALVLSLPFALTDRQFLTTLAFGVVLFTLFVQGPTIGPLLRRLGIVNRNKLLDHYDELRARLVMVQESETYLRDLHRRGVISSYAWEELGTRLTERISARTQDLRTLLDEHPELADFELNVARGEMLRAQRGVLLDLRRQGSIPDETFERLAVEIDAALSGQDSEEYEAAHQVAQSHSDNS